MTHLFHDLQIVNGDFSVYFSINFPVSVGVVHQVKHFAKVRKLRRSDMENFSSDLAAALVTSDPPTWWES